MKTYKTLSRVEKAKLLNLKISLNEKIEDQKSIKNELEVLEKEQLKISNNLKNNIAPGQILSLDSQMYYDSVLEEVTESINNLESRILKIKNSISDLNKEIKSAFTKKKSVDNLIENREKLLIESEKNKEFDDLDEYVMQTTGASYGN